VASPSSPRTESWASFLARSIATSTSQSHVDARLAELLTRIVDRTISGKIARTFSGVWTDRKPADEIIDARAGADHHVGDQARHRRVMPARSSWPLPLRQDKLFRFFVSKS
jgi:hypothetical protein